MFATIHAGQAKATGSRVRFLGASSAVRVASAQPPSRRASLLCSAAALIASIAVGQVESVLSHWGQ
jgi:hypothetical protein